MHFIYYYSKRRNYQPGCFSMKIIHIFTELNDGSSILDD